MCELQKEKSGEGGEKKQERTVAGEVLNVHKLESSLCGRVDLGWQLGNAKACVR